MRRAIVFTIFRKEILETLRDRRTLIFSFVLPVVVTYLAPLVSAEPMRTVSTELDCGDQDCSAAVGPVNVTYRVTLNNGQLPSYCAAGSAVASGVARRSAPRRRPKRPSALPRPRPPRRPSLWLLLLLRLLLRLLLLLLLRLRPNAVV